MTRVLLVGGLAAGQSLNLVPDVVRHGATVAADPPLPPASFKPVSEAEMSEKVTREAYRLHEWRCGEYETRWIGAPPHWTADVIFDELCRCYGQAKR